MWSGTNWEQCRTDKNQTAEDKVKRVQDLLKKDGE